MPIGSMRHRDYQTDSREDAEADKVRSKLVRLLIVRLVHAKEKIPTLHAMCTYVLAQGSGLVSAGPGSTFPECVKQVYSE